MTSGKKKKYRRKKRNPLAKFFSRVKRRFKKIFSSKEAPAKYRPYLGPDATKEDTAKKSYENTRANMKKYFKKQQKPEEETGFSMQKFLTGFNPLKVFRKKKKRKHSRRKSKRSGKGSRILFVGKILRGDKKTKGLQIDPVSEERSASEEARRIKGYIPYAINSTGIFLLSYFTMYFIYQFTVLIVASRWKLDAVLKYYDLAFNDQSPLWTRFNIILVTGSGPAICLLIGILLLRFVTNREKLSKPTKLFLLWTGIHGCNFFLGAFASGVSFDDGFGYVPLWLFFNVFWQILISLIFLFILGVVGYTLVPKFLDTSFSPLRVNRKNRIKFLFFQVVIPWFIGALVIFLIRIPNHLPYDTANTITLAFAVFPMLFNRLAKPTIHYKTEKKSNRVNSWMLAGLAGLIIIYRIGLNNGIHISMYYNFIFDLEIIPL